MTLFSVDMYFYLGISIYFSFDCEAVSTAVWTADSEVWSAILFPITSPVASAVIWFTLFEEASSEYVADYFPSQKKY